jgi:Zn-dependent protease with chaperone function
MFSKPLSFALVYIVTVFNVIVLASPILAVALPFISFNHNVVSMDYGVYAKIKLSFLILAFAVSFLMLCYLVLDFFIGFSMRSALKNCVRYEKIKDYDFLTDLFDQVKNKFGQKSVKLYVKDSDEINAFAISSLGGRAIVLTRGLINHYLVECDDPKMFLYAVRSVISHEMSHLINKDFLPTFLIITNQKVTNFASSILHVIFSLTVRSLRALPFMRGTSKIMSDAYTILNFIITAFNRFVVYNIYEFLRRFISRSVEYRCDRQAGKAFGGQNMALALSLMGEGGYFTLFSTHPGTKARIKKVENVKIQDAVVHPGFFDILANYFSLMMLVVICLYFAKQAQVDLFVREYIKNHETINRKISGLWQLVSKFF